MTGMESLGNRVHEDQILQELMGDRDAKQRSERAAVLRVYNYYRLVLSCALITLFYQPIAQGFVGVLEPQWFQGFALAYLALNMAATLFCMGTRHVYCPGQRMSVAILVIDITALTLIMLTSGGVESGLGNFLILPVAFAGVVLASGLSSVIPASAVIACFGCELYVSVTGAQQDNEYFFQVAVLGVAFFAVNAFFRYLTSQVAKRDAEVVSLEVLHRVRDVAESARHAEENTQAKFDVLLAATGDGVLGLDNAGMIIFANPRACQLLQIGYTDLMRTDIRRFMIGEEADAEELRNVTSLRRQKILDLLDLEVDRLFDPLQWQMANGEEFQVEYTCDATVNSRSEITGAVVLFKNVTEERRQQERLERLANFDPLTDLANRTYFNDAVRGAVARSRRNGKPLGVLLVDLDHFTFINEAMGHDKGDKLLKIAADRIKTTVRDGDLVARLNADQFAVALVDLAQIEDAAVVADKILRAIAEPIEIDGESANTTASIGIAVSDENTEGIDGLASATKSAVEAAKAQGRNTYCFFQPAMQRRAEEKRRVQKLLSTAVDNQEFNMVYQPIVSLKEERISSAEALIRWAPTGSDTIGPDVFVPIAEESGQINEIGVWILQTVSVQVKKWKEDLGIYPTIAINISSKQLKSDEFRRRFVSLLEEYEIPVEVIELELTETGVMDEPEKCMKELSLLSELGVRLSIDDFGTGYSSLDYLRRLPLDILKIDQSFTQGIGKSDKDEEIVRVMIRIAHAIGLKVICEGVETEEQLVFLQANDCDLVQGYLLSKPKSVDEITKLYSSELDGSFKILDGRG